jgi:hypothetical protein
MAGCAPLFEALAGARADVPLHFALQPALQLSVEVRLPA